MNTSKSKKSESKSLASTETPVVVSYPTITKLIDEDDILEFTIENIDVSLVNALRRIITAEIPTIVFRTFPYEENKATIDINTTRFNNEIIKQRLSCIPIYIDDIEFPIEDYVMEVDIINDSKEIIFITTKDFKIKNISTNTYIKEVDRDKIFPPNKITGDYIDFIRLQPALAENLNGEQLKLSCLLDKGTAKENGAFNIISTCAFGGTIDLALRDSKWNEKIKELKDESKDNLEFIKKDWELLDGNRFVIKNSFDFKIKSLGIYSNFKIMTQACNIIINKIKKFISDLNEKPIINPTVNTIDNCYDIILNNEDYTLGKVVEYLIYNKYFNSEVSFCGFRKPHPHIDSSFIRVAFKEDLDNENIKIKLTLCCNEGIAIFEKIKESFNED